MFVEFDFVWGPFYKNDPQIKQHMETNNILYTIIGLLCGECVFKAYDSHQQRKQNLS
jgi:hypothetical protein